jgi:tetratricopeptide (TPR) repeat protein
MNLNSIKSNSKPKAVINLREKASVELQSTTKSNISKKSSSKSESQIAKVNPKSRTLSNSQWILVLYNIISFAVISAVIVLDWSSVWQLPKAIVFVFGVTGFLLLASIFWIFGLIKHSVAITLGDILFIISGLAVFGITFINPNRLAFWGSTARIFDAGIVIGFLVVFYIGLKLFLSQKALSILSFFVSILILVGAGISGIAGYWSDVLVRFSILTRLQPTNTWLTESPQELGLLTLLSINFIFTILAKINSKTFIYKVFNVFYYLAIIIHILVLIRLSGNSMYILSILNLVVHTIFYLKKISSRHTLQSKSRLITIRASAISGIIIIAIISAMIIRPFQDNIQIQEYPIIAKPGLDISLDIMRQSIQSDTWFGSGNIIYAWDRFAPDNISPQLSGFSFETLFNEIINIIVKNGVIVSGLLILLALWVLLSILRVVLIQKTVPVEILPLILSLGGLFLIPFSIINKVIFIIILVLWSNIFTKYFKPIFKLNLDINTIPASISSLFTFITLFSISLVILGSSKIYNIIQSQAYIVRASQVQDNLEEQVKLLSQAQMKSPYMVEYTNLYIQALIKKINAQSFELFNSNNENNVRSNIDPEKQKTVQDNIQKTQELIDEYKTKFTLDSRVIYWQLELSSLIHQYGEVDENEYLAFISKGRDLKPQSQDWDIYEAQYYARQAQKGEKINSEQLEKAKSILNTTIDKNKFSAEAYKNYYDLLSLSEAYEEQIDILEEYVQIVNEKSIPANQELVYLLGLAYQNNNQYIEAIAVYNKLLETFPNYTNVYFKLGEIYEIEKKFDLAKQNYQKVLELDPKAEPARLKLEQLR